MGFKKGQLRVLSHAWDRNLGGRDLDNALFEYFAQEFQEKYKLDVRTNARASFRLRMACEKVRNIQGGGSHCPQAKTVTGFAVDGQSLSCSDCIGHLADDMLLIRS